MGLKTYIIYLILIIILVTAQTTSADTSQGNVTRNIIYSNNGGVQILNISLIPQPLELFSLPGYYVEEELPANATVISNNADWSKLTGNKLEMIRFAPSRDNIAISYQIKLSNINTTINGIFKDKYKNTGRIINKIISQDAQIQSRELQDDILTKPISTKIKIDADQNNIILSLSLALNLLLILHISKKKSTKKYRLKEIPFKQLPRHGAYRT